MPDVVLMDDLTQEVARRGLSVALNGATPLGSFLDNTLDVVFHVAVLFTALVLLLQFVIAPLSRDSLTNTIAEQLRETIRSNLQLTHDEKKVVQASEPALQALYRISAQPSEEVQANNAWLFTYAHSVAIALFLLFGVLAWVFFRLFNAGLAGKPTLKVLRSNLLLIFPAILVAELMFFEIIATKMPPAVPSDLVAMMQDIFNAHRKDVTVADLRMT